MEKEGYVSIQAVNDMLEYCRSFDGNDAIYIFEKWFREQEPVQPKMGHWIRMKAYEKWGCSECHTVFRFTFKEHDYCPKCGCAMKGELE